MAAHGEVHGQVTAGEMEEEVQKSHEKITVRVANAKNLQGLKGSTLTSFVRVEFGSQVIGESPKCENDSTNGITVFDYECTLNANVNDPMFLDELVQTPFVISVVEVLPKEKKAREEKTNVVGQTCLDPLPLLQGEAVISRVLQLFSGAATQDSTVSQELNLPEIEVSLAVEELLFSHEQLKACNLLRMGIDNLYSLPESWSQSTGTQFMYFVALPMPVSANKEVTVFIPNGTFHAPGELENSNFRKWCSAPTASGSCLYMSDRRVTSNPYENDDGDLQGKDDLVFRKEAESEKACVTWNIERRCFFTKTACESLMKKIAQNRIWPLEVFRTTLSQGSKTNKKGEEENILSFHGVVYVDMAPLLYPGMKRIRGAFLVKPYSETDLNAKTGRKSIVTEEAAKLILLARTSSSGLPPKAPATKAKKQEEKPKPSAAVLKPPDQALDSEHAEMKKSEGQQFVDAHSYMVLDFELDSSLVPRREPDALAKKVLELVPPRPLFSKKEGGAKKAIENFQNHIGVTANMLLDDYQKMFSADLDSEQENGADKRRREFLYHLNSSGKYFAMKEQLKYYVVKIVREKFMNTSQFKTKTELQEFISQLYEFLLSHMHQGLSDFLSTEESVEIPPPIRDSEMMKFFAREAEILFDYPHAAKYYQERISLNKNDPECWLDYGCFCLFIDDTKKAQECFKEVVSIDQKHFIGLVLNGCMALFTDDFTSAEVFFESAAYSHPDNEIGWTLLGLFYSGVHNDIMAERAFNEACRLNDPNLSAKKSYIDINNGENEKLTTSKEGLTTTEHPSHSECSDEPLANQETPKQSEVVPKNVNTMSPFLQAARFLIDHRVLNLTERALSHELVAPGHGESASYFQLLAETQVMKKSYSEAKSSIDECLKLHHQNPDAWALLGHLHFLTGDQNEAKIAYERTLSYCSDAKDKHSLLLRLASIYLNEKEYSKAKQTYLEACSKTATCMTWLGAGIASYRLGELKEAEHALNEANILDNHNTVVWAYLTLVCLKQKRHLEAEQCYQYAVKTGPSESTLMEEIKNTMKETGFDISLIM